MARKLKVVAFCTVAIPSDDTCFAAIRTNMSHDFIICVLALKIFGLRSLGCICTRSTLEHFHLAVLAVRSFLSATIHVLTLLRPGVVYPLSVVEYGTY